MKTKSNRGFTIVELVIVIAVIAILAAVLIPTFSNVIKKANQSKYLQLAKNTLTQVIVNNDGSVEDDTYIFITNGDENVAWYKYNDGTLLTLDAEPELEWDSACPMSKRNTDYVPENVKVYRPIVKNVVNKLNDLLVDEFAITYEKIADAGKELSNLEMDIINFRETGYKFAYSLTTNKVFITNDDLTEVKYSNTGIETVPSDKKVLTGTNINSADDLVEFSRISNKHENSVPTEDNIFVNKSNSPLVIFNLNNNIDIANESFLSICNWHNFANRNNGYQEISLLLNGNSHTISNLNQSFIGGLGLGSIIRDISLLYNIGSSDTAVKSSSFYSTTNNPTNNKDLAKYHTGLFANATSASKATLQPEDNIMINNLTLGGEVYFNNDDESANEMAIVFGGVFTYLSDDSNNHGSHVTFGNLNLFSFDNDHFEFSGNTGDGVGLLIGNMDPNGKNSSVTTYIKYNQSSIQYNESNIKVSGKFSQLTGDKFIGIVG